MIRVVLVFTSPARAVSVRAVVALVLALALSLALVGCSNPGRREAASLAAAVERFQRAENVQRPALAKEVAAVSCTDEAVKPACDACRAAADSTGRAIALKEGVARALKDVQSGALTRDEAGKQNLDGQLVEAQRLLLEAQEQMPRCESDLMALKRKYAL